VKLFIFFLLLNFFSTCNAQGVAESCLKNEKDLLSAYADEWDLSSSELKKNYQHKIQLGSHPSLIIRNKIDCSKEVCLLSIFLKRSETCWENILSLEGKIRPLKDGDWNSLQVEYSQSLKKPEQKAITTWHFNPAFKKFEKVPKLSQ
jgi:hypothetical protein